MSKWQFRRSINVMKYNCNKIEFLKSVILKERETKKELLANLKHVSDLLEKIIDCPMQGWDMDSYEEVISAIILVNETLEKEEVKA